MVEKGDVVVGSAGNVTAFLKNASPLGFQLGRTPLNAFVKQNQASLFQGIASTDVAATTESIKTLHRLYQITPSNDSLQAAVKLGLTSAYDIAAFDAQDFLERFGAAFPSTDEAMLVYQKAQQVNTTILHLYLAAKQLDTSPAIYSLSPDSSVREACQSRHHRTVPHHAIPVRLAGLLRLRGLSFGVKPRRVSGRSAALYRPARCAMERILSQLEEHAQSEKLYRYLSETL